ncbi:MAG: response regulator [Magnetococcales bacterium]|nr:response regulator [Magnetococcales bacterium]
MENNNVLVVDDEPVVFQAIQSCLDDAYPLFHAKNGKEGLEMYEKINPALLILDIKMPVMDGFEVLEKLNLETTSPFGVIVLTGHVQGQEVGRCYELGISSFLRKPFNIFELRGLVKQSLASQRYLDALRREQKYSKSLLDCSSNIIFSTDDDMNVVAFNPAAEACFGYSFEEVATKGIRSLFADPNQADMIDVLLDTRSFAGEVRFLKKDGSFIEAHLTCARLRDDDGTAFGMVANARDITNEKKIRALMESKKIADAVRRVKQ